MSMGLAAGGSDVTLEVGDMIYVAVALAGLLAGLLVGLAVGFLVGKRATQWCPACGLTLSADHCPTHSPAGGRSALPDSKMVQR
jgi:hypothetical protein